MSEHASPKSYTAYLAFVAAENAAKPDRRKHRYPLRRDLYERLIRIEMARTTREP